MGIADLALIFSALALVVSVWAGVSAHNSAKSVKRQAVAAEEILAIERGRRLDELRPVFTLSFEEFSEDYFWGLRFTCQGPRSGYLVKAELLHKKPTAAIIALLDVPENHATKRYELGRFSEGESRLIQANPEAGGQGGKVRIRLVCRHESDPETAWEIELEAMVPQAPARRG